MYNSLMSRNHSSESGSAIFYVLLAVGLLAALSFAVVQGDRSSIGKVAGDKARLSASEIMDYGAVLKKATVQLRLRGTTLSNLSFAHSSADAAYGTYDNSPDDEVFNPEGGAVLYTVPNPIALAVAGRMFEFYGENEVELVGSTCGATACADLIAAVAGLKEEVCIQINNALSVGAEDAAPPSDTAMDTTRYGGSFGYTRTIGDEDADLAGKSAACFENTSTGEYVYYQVLIAR